MDWFRSWHGAPTDMKWLVIAKRANVPAGMVSAVAWALLDYASQQTDRGSVKGFDCETYAVYSGFEIGDIEHVLAAMREKGVIVDERLAAWDKRQPQREDSSAERTAAYRDRKRTVTHSDAPVTQRDAEKRNMTQCDAPEQSRADTEQSRAEQQAISPRTVAPESPQAAAADLSDFALVEQAHGQFIGARMGLAQAQTYEQWLKLTSPQAIIDALSEAARSANRNGGRYKYALAILNRQKEDRTLPMPARPPEMDVIDLPPEMTAPMPWL